MDLSNLEKKAIAKVLLEIMNADDQVVTAESLTMLDLQNKLGISMDLVMDAKSLNAYTCLDIISKMNASNKAIVVAAMWRMIVADGKEHPKEIEVFNTVCELGQIHLNF